MNKKKTKNAKRPKGFKHSGINMAFDLPIVELGDNCLLIDGLALNAKDIKRLIKYLTDALPWLEEKSE